MPLPVRYLLAADLLLVLLHVVGPPMPLWESRTGDEEYLWDLSAEGNLPTWYSSVKLAVLALLLLAFAWVSRSRSSRATWILGFVGAAFLVLSMDELIGIHERLAPEVEDLVGERGGSALDVTGPWMLVAAPLFLGGLALAAYLGRDLLRDRRRISLLYLLGAVTFVLSFAGLELLRNFAGEDYVPVIEETGEMLAVTVLIWATLELMRSHRVSLIAAGEHSPG
jgi:hypothetical protein